MNDLTASAKRFEAGDLDYVGNLNPAELDGLRERLGDEVVRTPPALGIYYYAINLHKKKFQDVRVRKALNLLINRDVAVRTIAPGSQPAYAFTPPGIANYVAKEDLPHMDFMDKPYEARVEEAKALMKAAGYSEENPLVLTLSYDGDGEHKRLAVQAMASWKQAYMQVNSSSADLNTHWAKVKSGDFDVARARWVGDYNDPNTFLNLLGGESGRIYTRYSNPEVDVLIKREGETQDLQERATILATHEQKALDDYAIIPIYFLSQRYLISKRVHYLADENITGFYPYQHFSIAK